MKRTWALDSTGAMAWLKWASALVALVGILWTASWTFESRYARASDVAQQIAGVKTLYLQAERRDLARQKFELEVAAERRPLTTLERRRLEEVRDELRRVDEAIKAFERKSP